jgi:hypothetical protein
VLTATASIQVVSNDVNNASTGPWVGIGKDPLTVPITTGSYVFPMSLVTASSQAAPLAAWAISATDLSFHTAPLPLHFNTFTSSAVPVRANDSTDYTPKLLALLYEVNAMYRQVFIDGRPFPADMNPTWNGYSVGHWEGDTLVVETRGFRDDLWIDTWGSPMSDIAKMTERIRRPNFGTLEIELTVDDPKNYTKPFTVTLAQDFEPDTELVDEFCLEGENSYQRMIRSRGK